MDSARTTGRFMIYGVAVESDFPFRYHLEPATGAPELYFRYGGVVAEADPTGREVYTSPERAADGRSGLRLYVGEEADTIIFTGIASFRCSQSEIRIIAHREGVEYLVEIALMGTVLSYWLERRGTLALHAAAVVTGGKAACFVAGTSRGKTTTACAFLAAGRALLSDDIVPIRMVAGVPVASPAFPQMKLLPEQLAHLGDRPDGYERIHPEFEKLMVPISAPLCYHAEAVPVGGVYLLDRCDGERAGGNARGGGSEAGPVLERVGAGEALRELLRHSFAAELVDAAGGAGERLGRLAAIAGAISVYRLRLPSGYNHLDEVRRVIETTE